jgi:hypothetical protein
MPKAKKKNTGSAKPARKKVTVEDLEVRGPAAVKGGGKRPGRVKY